MLGVELDQSIAHPRGLGEAPGEVEAVGARPGHRRDQPRPPGGDALLVRRLLVEEVAVGRRAEQRDERVFLEADILEADRAGILGAAHADQSGAFDHVEGAAARAREIGVGHQPRGLGLVTGQGDVVDRLLIIFGLDLVEGAAEDQAEAAPRIALLLLAAEQAATRSHALEPELALRGVGRFMRRREQGQKGDGAEQPGRCLAVGDVVGLPVALDIGRSRLFRGLGAGCGDRHDDQAQRRGADQQILQFHARTPLNYSGLRNLRELLVSTPPRG
jgi:hypothetical protein